MSSWKKCAVLTGTKTLDGRLIARSVQGLPFLLEPGMQVYFVPPVLDSPRSAVVADVNYGSGSDYLVSFEGIKSKNEALPLVGCYCLASADELDELSQALAEDNLEGYEVYENTNGFVGVSLGIEELGPQVLLHIQKQNQKEVLIPFVDEFVLDIDVDKQRIDLSLPPGLLDLEY